MNDETKAKATRVLARCGHAAVLADCLSPSRLARVAALELKDGKLTDQAREKVRQILVKHYEAAKATHADLD